MSRVIRLTSVESAGQNRDGTWFRVDGLGIGLTVYVQQGRDELGLPIVTGITVDGGHIRTEKMRMIPLGDIERMMRIGQPPFVREDFRRYDPVFPRRDSGESREEFLMRVSDAYKYYASLSAKPSVEIAQDGDVPVGTVRRWVREAREHGLLEPGRRGRAG